ncbi:MAG TPA: riboflavin synthase [Actinomycetota bacterium]|nr:riboflavin synthase [Actinomycetota bacterium]
MFTGIVTHLGKVAAARARGGLLALEIAAPDIAKELHKGDSVAVNGVCLTAVDTSRRRFRAEVMGETLARSTFEELRKGAVVNLELPARLSDRLGGHLVQGHVDGIARVIRTEDGDGSRRLWLEAPDEVLRYLVGKGSVALDGVSLTIVEVGRTSFQVAIIPHTLAETTIGALKVGSKVNVEVDVLAKYVERLMERR